MSTAKNLSALVNSLQGLARSGVVWVDEKGKKKSVLRRAPAGAPYLIVEQVGTGARFAPSEALGTSIGLAAVGASVRQFSVLGTTTDGFRLSVGQAGRFGDTPGLNADDMVTKMTAMNMQFLKLQEAVQMESRRFHTLTTASNARHEIALNAIKNFR
jgi:hypothetical protein